jgi:hypothetical protein
MDGTIILHRHFEHPPRSFRKTENDYDLNITQTSPRMQSLAPRQSSLSGWFREAIENGPKTNIFARKTTVGGYGDTESEDRHVVAV